MRANIQEPYISLELSSTHFASLSGSFRARWTFWWAIYILYYSLFLSNFYSISLCICMFFLKACFLDTHILSYNYRFPCWSVSLPLLRHPRSSCPLSLFLIPISLLLSFFYWLLSFSLFSLSLFPLFFHFICGVFCILIPYRYIYISLKK
jgi:hypothetical protein